MKRLIPVLAIMLILVLCVGDNASARRYPAIRIDEVQYDHPWGGDEHITNPPPIGAVVTVVPEDMFIIQIIKSWQYRFFIGGIITSRPVTRTTTTIITLPDNSTTTNNQVSDSRGNGQ